MIHLAEPFFRAKLIFLALETFSWRERDTGPERDFWDDILYMIRGRFFFPWTNLEFAVALGLHDLFGAQYELCKLLL